jgi:soluble P-type ATPase
MAPFGYPGPADMRVKKKAIDEPLRGLGGESMVPRPVLSGNIKYNSLVIELTIPGRGTVRLLHLVCDVNGTLALDGRLMDQLVRPLNELQDRLALHLITADTHGRQAEIDRRLQIQAVRLEPGNEVGQKVDFVKELGADTVVAIGQGANDAGMLREAAIGICVLSEEGTALPTLMSADLVAPDIFSAVKLLEKPLRLVASLRQ